MSGISELGKGEEFDKIRSLINSLGDSARSIGDDAAAIDFPRDQQLVISTDSCVEGVHFRREWLSAEEIGFRATASALSDIAAMGANPIGVLVAIAISRNDRDLLDAIARGAGMAARNSGASVVGGDLAESAQLSITVTVFGSSKRPLLRSGAKSGDSVYITGEIGGSALGLAALLCGEEPPAGARNRFTRPVARIGEGLWLGARGVNACIDLSDGLAGDLGHIAAASGVNIVIDTELLPLFPGCTLEEALGSGEEYELCVTSAVEIDTEAFQGEFGIPLTRIGVVEPSASPAVIFHGAGNALNAPASYSHFRK